MITHKECEELVRKSLYIYPAEVEGDEDEVSASVHAVVDCMRWANINLVKDLGKEGYLDEEQLSEILSKLYK